jgi:hypothetical protein
MADEALPDTLTPEQAARLGLVPPPAKAAGVDALPDTLTPEQAQRLGLTGAPASPPGVEPPSFLGRLKEGAGRALDVAKAAPGALVNFATRAVPAAIDLVSPISKSGGLQVPFGQLADPAYRREFERGVSDVVTGGLAERAANRVDPAFAASAEPDVAAQPGARSAGSLLGAALPSPFSKAGAGAAEAAGASNLVRGLPLPARAAVAAGAGGATTAGTQALASGADLPEALGAAAGGGVVSAPIGAVTGAAVAAKEKIANGSPAKARARIMSDLQGESAGYSTKTARNQAVRDEADIADVVLRDRKLETDLLKAKGNDVPALGNVIATVDDRLATEGAPRESYYKRLAETLPARGIRSGDYVNHLEREAKALEATGDQPDRKIARQLRNQIKTIKTSEQWGYTPTAPVAADPENAAALEQLVKRRDAFIAKDVPVPQTIDDAIEGLRKPGHSEFNPDHVVSPLQLRRNVTSMQREAEASEGGLHGTPNYELGREVAARGEDYLRQIKQQAAKKDPDLIAAINEHDRQVSALLHMRKVLEQRLNNAKLAGMGTEGDDMFGRALHTISKGKAGVIKAVEAEAARKVILGKRALERGARGPVGETDAEYTIRIAQGLKDGLSLKAAVAAASVDRRE